jgi:hypothetical protein
VSFFLSRGWVRALLHPRAPVPWARLLRAHLALLPFARGSQSTLKKSFFLSFFLSLFSPYFSCTFVIIFGAVAFLLYQLWFEFT